MLVSGLGNRGGGLASKGILAALDAVEVFVQPVDGGRDDEGKALLPEVFLAGDVLHQRIGKGRPDGSGVVAFSREGEGELLGSGIDGRIPLGGVRGVAHWLGMVGRLVGILEGLEADLVLLPRLGGFGGDEVAEAVAKVVTLNDDRLALIVLNERPDLAASGLACVAVGVEENPRQFLAVGLEHQTTE